MTGQLTIIARLTARPESADALGEALASLVAPTRTEEGLIDYHLHRNNDDSCVWVLYENWKSRADLDAHFAKPYTRAVLERFPNFLAKEMELTFCSMVSARPA